ncbi:MAG: carbohydrate ABC transporter permease [Clostridia bacterium]|nr:carbohydrate ABC transporter permease [Clostridia bacterium]
MIDKAIATTHRKSRLNREWAFPTVNVVLLVLLMFLTLYPVINTVAYSFNDGTDALRGHIGLWPRKFSLVSYKNLLSKPELYQSAKITVLKTILTTILNLLITGMLSFTLSCREYVLRKFITTVMVLTMYVNAGLIPNYLLVTKTLGLHNTFWAYIIPSMFSCFNMIIIRTYIMGLPDALVESARIDGAGDFRVYWQIIFPLCTPVLATVALFVAVGSWNSWFDTYLYNSAEPDLHTLQYFLKMQLATTQAQANKAKATVEALQAADVSTTPVTIRCATTVITTVPILIVYPFLQRYFVTGIALGSVKG